MFNFKHATVQLLGACSNVFKFCDSGGGLVLYKDLKFEACSIHRRCYIRSTQVHFVAVLNTVYCISNVLPK